MDIKEGEEVQAKDTSNLFNKITAENFPTLENEIPIQVQEAFRMPKRHDQNGTSPWHVIVKTIAQRVRNEY
jgi:hypothetical protein